MDPAALYSVLVACLDAHNETRRAAEEQLKLVRGAHVFPCHSLPNPAALRAVAHRRVPHTPRSE